MKLNKKQLKALIENIIAEYEDEHRFLNEAITSIEIVLEAIDQARAANKDSNNKDLGAYNNFYKHADWLKQQLIIQLQSNVNI